MDIQMLARSKWIISYGSAALGAIFLVVTLLSLGPLTPALWLGLAAMLAALLAKRAAVVLFLALLPVFGNRPGSAQAFLLLLTACGLQVGMLLPTFRGQRLLPPKGSNLLLLLAVLWLCISLLSLSSLPLAEWFYSWYSSSPRWGDLSALSYRALQLAQATEERVDYSILSVIWTLFSLNLAVHVYELVKADQAQAIRFTAAILGGLIISLAAGLADYYSLIDLRFLRALDPVVNPGDVQFRLQSFFGHSGWFAEYVTLAIPCTMLLLALRIPFWTRLSLVLFLLLVGEITLILTFQRGGWLSYPLTLVVVWAAIYLTRRLERGEKNVAAVLRQSTLKVILSLPLSVGLSVLALLAANYMGWLGPGRQVQISQYVQRAKDIQRASDRTSFMKAAFLLGARYPVLGAGSESFAFQYRREFKNEGGAFRNQIDLPLHGSAHNVYFQTFAGKGAFGLVVLISLLVLQVWASFRCAIHDPQLTFRSRLVLLVCAACAVAFLIYGNVQEVFYVSSLQFLFFAMLGMTAALAEAQLAVSVNINRVVAGAAIVAIAAHGLWLSRVPYWPNWLSASEMPFGCFGRENDPILGDYRWCGPRARLSLPVRQTPSGPTATLSVQAGLRTKTASFLVLQRGALLYERGISPGQRYHLEIPLHPETAESEVLLDLRTAGYFIPKRDMPDSNDIRTLSFRVFEHSP